MSDKEEKQQEKLLPPTHYEPEYLYKKYEPLRRASYKKFKDMMANDQDRQDLMSNVDQVFLQLVSEYDPNRGVDFPYYIKKMLDLRIYHFVSKYLDNVNKETYAEDELVIQDDSFDEILQRIIDLNSINPDLVLGEKHRKLMIGVLIERKTLKELAEEEGVPPDRLHARLYFLIKKLTKSYEEDKEIYGDDLY